MKLDKNGKHRISVDFNETTKQIFMKIEGYPESIDFTLEIKDILSSLTSL
jgi:hypothetical protein